MTRKQLISQLNKLLSDKNLTDEKLWKASVGLLPKIADLLNKDLSSERKEEQNLLDHFAGLAMQGILSAQTEMRAHGHNYIEEGIKYLSKESYAIASAMLKARKEALKND